jgi:hypothetical protein
MVSKSFRARGIFWLSEFFRNFQGHGNIGLVEKNGHVTVSCFGFVAYWIVRVEEGATGMREDKDKRKREDGGKDG